MLWWYVTRSTGIVATVLLGLSLIWGLRFSARETGGRARPAWWLDLHNMLGGLALAFTGAHVFAVTVDPDAGFTLVQALVPGSATDLALAIGYGRRNRIEGRPTDSPHFRTAHPPSRRPQEPYGRSWSKPHRRRRSDWIVRRGRSSQCRHDHGGDGVCHPTARSHRDPPSPSG